jgi:aryl-alcohol dehydrogenase-like predicted oxidoreductase
MGVIVKEAVANGRLTARGDQPEFVAMAEQQGVAPDALALAYVLSRPWVDVALSGAATAEQLASNLAARDVEWTEELEAGSRGLVIAPDAYWEQRSALAWN